MNAFIYGYLSRVYLFLKYFNKRLAILLFRVYPNNIETNINKQQEPAMTESQKQKEETANRLLAQFSIKQLCEQWEVTNKQSITIELAKVRSWLQNELERRDQVKFDEWIDCPDVDKMDHPAIFFLGVK